LEGYTSADSIAISESFAKRLTTYDEAILYLDKASNVYKLITKKKVKFDLYTLKQIFPERNDAILLSYQNVHISKIDDVDKKYARVFLAWEIPFRLGDKITNLHGAKGTVGFILPDKDMPKLTKKVGNMKAGPLDIIISGYSTIRRGSLGQIFEAWALASGIDYEGHDYIAEMMEQYSSQMKTYSKNSIVEYKGEKKVIPVGINYIMRLYHHASTHISVSSANTAFQKTLKFGEMEKLNLVANDCPNILLELGIRSIKKYIGSHKLVDEMERTRELPDRKDLNISLQFIEILKSMGYDKKMINKVYILLRPENIERAIDYLTEFNGYYQHNFISSNNPKEKNLCFICKKTGQFHLNYTPDDNDDLKFNLNKDFLEKDDGIIKENNQNNNIAECEVCYDDIDGENIDKNKIPCGHLFCTNC
jgi:hypothetical protein